MTLCTGLPARPLILVEWRNSVNFLISCNDAYAMPTEVMLTSLLTVNPQGSHTVYILESELSENAFRRIKSCAESLGARCRDLHIREDCFASSRTRSYISKETYYRLLAAKFLPQDLNRVLWLDSDMIIRDSIRELYDQPFEGKAVVACGYGAPMQELIGRNAQNLGMNDPEHYFNAGVMLINLPLWRENMTQNRIQEGMDRIQGSDSLFPGQDLTNLLMDGSVRMEDYRRFNSMVHCISGAGDLQYALENAAVVHFSGEAKPWKFNDIHFADEWMQWYRKCFGENAHLKRMSYFRLKELFKEALMKSALP